MELTKKRIDEIKPYFNNPRKNDEAVAAVIESIKQCTYIAPIVIDEEGVILAGHTRYKALKSMSIEECEVIVADGLTDEQKKKYRFLDNKIGEKSTWDVIKLFDELEGLDLGGFDFFQTPDKKERDNEAINDAIEGAQELEVDDYEDEQFKYECPRCGFRFN